MEISILVAEPKHVSYAEDICKNYDESAKARGTGIAKRKPEYISEKIKKGNGVIALYGDQLAGFCYIETWSHHKYVANSGLIIVPEFRKQGLARRLKAKVFELSRTKFPAAKIFGITTSLAVMKINSQLGYQPVTFSELTQDDAFWEGCKSCPNYDILLRNERRLCLCTAMLAPSQEEMKHDLSHLINAQDAK
ncbi:MAG: GNAT family N-acetyltransferase [Saprospiraceae bacterium]